MTEDDSALSPGDLIAGLCLEAGRIMEDMSVELAMAAPSDAIAMKLRLELLLIASQDLVALSAAAIALQRRHFEVGPLS